MEEEEHLYERSIIAYCQLLQPIFIQFNQNKSNTNSYTMDLQRSSNLELNI